MDAMPRITVFTPAYNRAHTLPRTYESLCRQTCKDFLWMIIDDGSSDNTRELVQSWLAQDNGFPIEYYYKPNGGMHTAHNLAYRKIVTELNVCIDSDDAMPPDAVEKILRFWNNFGSDKVAGIIALDSDFEGNVIGTELPSGICSLSTSALYEKYHAKGDKKFIYRTDVINSVPCYPEFQGERLVPLGYKYVQVAQKYEMLLMNEIVCWVDYQPNGSSNTIVKQYFQSPRGFAADKAICMKYDATFCSRFKAAIHYTMDCSIAKDRQWLKNSPKKLLAIAAYPFGVAAKLYFRRKLSKSFHS